MNNQCAKCDKPAKWSDLCEGHYWEMVNSGKCRWVEEEECWATQCGNAFVIIDGTPSDNEMVYCPYCGKEILDIRNG